MYNYTINLKLDSREISIRTMALPKGILDELNLNTMEAKGESFFKNNYNPILDFIVYPSMINNFIDALISFKIYFIFVPFKNTIPHFSPTNSFIC